MEFLYFGIDISKDTLDYAACKLSDKQIVEVDQIKNDPKGIKAFIKKLKRIENKQKVWVCFENTGHYGLLLTHLLQEAAIDYSMISAMEIIKSSGLTRGKSDPIDAQRIATYAAVFSHKLEKTILPSNEILRIKTLLAMRENFVKARTQFKNAQKALEISDQTISLKKEIKLYQKSIKECDQKIRLIEDQIKALVKSQKQIDKNYKKITQVIGIGPITAAFIICYTNNFNTFDNPRKFNCFCGLAPFQHTSGKSINGKTKTSKYRNKILKKLLFNAASTALQHDMQLRTYYNRKMREGKHFMSVKNAVACKIVYRVFAVVKREEPFLKLSN
jgi:transposase